MYSIKFSKWDSLACTTVTGKQCSFHVLVCVVCSLNTFWYVSVQKKIATMPRNMLLLLDFTHAPSPPDFGAVCCSCAYHKHDFWRATPRHRIGKCTEVVHSGFFAWSNYLALQVNSLFILLFPELKASH